MVTSFLFFFVIFVVNINLLDLALWAEKILKVFLCNLKNAYTGQLILRKISKIGATKCQIIRLKFTRYDYCWGSAPDPAGELTALPQIP